MADVAAGRTERFEKRSENVLSFLVVFNKKIVKTPCQSGGKPVIIWISLEEFRRDWCV